jgi:hypothetical protein
MGHPVSEVKHRPATWSNSCIVSILFRETGLFFFFITLSSYLRRSAIPLLHDHLILQPDSILLSFATSWLHFQMPSGLLLRYPTWFPFPFGPRSGFPVRHFTPGEKRCVCRHSNSGADHVQNTNPSSFNPLCWLNPKRHPRPSDHDLGRRDLSLDPYFMDWR